MPSVIQRNILALLVWTSSGIALIWGFVYFNFFAIVIGGLGWTGFGLYLLGSSILALFRRGSRLRGLLFITLIPMSLGLQYLTLTPIRKHPADEKLIAEFYQYRPEYEHLLLMLREDRGLGRVGEGFIRPANYFSGDSAYTGSPPSDDRIAEYHTIFDRLSLMAGIEGYDDKSYVSFVRSVRGLSISGSSKGIAYSENVPKLLVEDLDKYWSPDGRSFRAHRHIEGNWYLWFDYVN
jgi:hypothetical protein